MKRLLFLSLVTLVACSKPESNEVKKGNAFVWAEHMQSILPLEKDKAWEGSDLTNASANFDEEKILNTITRAVKDGKLKAYADYPNKELSQGEIEKLLVYWDSTAQAENPNNPGEFVTAPIKYGIEPWNVPKIVFHETIELDTVTNVLTKNVSHITLYTTKLSPIGETVGAKKLFDVKFNTDKKSQ